MFAINLPGQIKTALAILNTNNYEAYIVGGCIRDIILGGSPCDWDIATSAAPNEMLGIFRNLGHKVIETGIQHGTITVLIDQMPIEITTFRIDGEYSDNRHPDSVAFTRNLKEDLSRRDFTINALAYNPETGLIDLSNGVNDIHNKVIRCVGEPDKRFSEDALRMMRALRFSSALGFTIEENTAQSIHKNKALLKNIAVERISAELTKLLCGKNVVEVLLQYSLVIAEIIPEILPMFGFEQNNPHHIYNVWEHTVRAVGAINPVPYLRLTMFFHDIGKPHRYSVGANGIGHFYGHGLVSERMAIAILQRLRFDKQTINRVAVLIKRHDLRLTPEKKIIKRWLNRLSEDVMRDLFKVMAADQSAKSPEYNSQLELIAKLEPVLDEVLANGDCFLLKDLALNGNDLKKLGIKSGREIGYILNVLLTAVIEGKCKNDKDSLTSYLHKIKKEKK